MPTLETILRECIAVESFNDKRFTWMESPDSLALSW